MKPINVSGTYSFEEVLLIVNDAIDRAGDLDFDGVGVGELIDIVNHLVEREDAKSTKPAKKRGRPKGSTKKQKADEQPEEKKEVMSQAENGTETPAAASAVTEANEDDFAGI